MDIPYVFGDDSCDVANYTTAQLEMLRTSTTDLHDVPPISSLDDDDIIEISNTAGPSRIRNPTKSWRVGEIKEVINERVDVNNPTTRKKAVVLAAKYPGDCTIDQICSIYDYMRDGWHYVSDIRGIDYFSSASESLEIGEEIGSAGAGDCDDFAILMSALIESIGGTTRIVLAYNESQGHAYTEVYMGNLNLEEEDVEEIVNWLRDKYETDKIFTHVESNTMDVWLNLDWWGEGIGHINYPGGPFFPGDNHVVLSIRDQFGKISLKKPPNAQKKTDIKIEEANLPPTIDYLIPELPSPQAAGTAVTWRASASDPNGDPLEYKFLHRGPREDWKEETGWINSGTWIWNTTNSDAGNNEIRLLVRDGKHEEYDDSLDVKYIIRYGRSLGVSGGSAHYSYSGGGMSGSMMSSGSGTGSSSISVSFG